MYRNTATQSTVRRLNERAVVRFLQVNGGATTRATCAKALGMSQPTAGKIVDDLVSRGVVAEVDAEAPAVGSASVAPRMGRPGQLLGLDQNRPRFILIQLGVRETRIVAAPVGQAAETNGEDSWAESFPTPASPQAWSARLLEAARRLPRRGLWATVLSVPGVVDESAAKVLFSPNLHWSEAADLRAMCREAWRLPTLIIQEIRALALGHRLAEPIQDDFLLVDFGTGVGAAAVIGGQLFSSGPLSGELGHTPVSGNSRRCGCGATGCLETLVSRKGLLQSFAESAGSRNLPRSWPTFVTQLRPEVLSGPAGAGLRASLNAAAAAIAGALNVLGLRRAVITGSLTEIPPALDYLSQAVVRGSMWARFGTVSCSAAPRRRALGLVAAAIDRQLLSDGEFSSANRVAHDRSSALSLSGRSHE